MTLDIKKNSSTALVPCVPCCFNNCDNGNAVMTHLFVFDIFQDNPNCVSSTRNDNYNSSGIGGVMTGNITSDGFVYTLSTSCTNPNHSIVVEIKNLNNSWSGRSNIDNAGFTSWEPLKKTFSNELMFRITGTIAGKEVLMHGFCSCDFNHYDAYFVGAYYYIGTGKRYYVTVNGLPSCWQSVTNSFSFEHTLPPTFEPVTVGQCAGQIHFNTGLWSFNHPVEMNQAAVICNNGWPILLIVYYFKPDSIITNISDTTFPVGHQLNYQVGIQISTPPNIMDLSFPTTFDLNPFYFNCRSRLVGDWEPNGAPTSPSYLETHPTFVEVIATE